MEDRPAVYQNASQRTWELGVRCPSGRYRLGADGRTEAAGTLPTPESQEAASIEDFKDICLRLVVTRTSVVSPVKLFISWALEIKC